VEFVRLIGVAGGIGGFLFCCLILLFNPYTHSSAATDVFLSFTFMYLLPIMLAIYASISMKPKLLIACSIWAMPLSLYCLATPGVFKFLVIAPVLLLITGIQLYKK
jgi:hypothetical protein